MPAPNTFSYIAKTDTKKIIQARICALQNHLLPLWFIEFNENVIKIKLKFLKLLIIKARCDFIKDGDYTCFSI